MTDDLPIDPAAPSAAPAAHPERARIEPSVEPAKRDALPILYLVGFLILVSALIYVWRHPTMPQGAVQQAGRVDVLRQDVDQRRQEMAALAARLTQLEARPAAQPADLGPVDARLKALETRPAAAAPDLKPIDARLAALEARPLPPPQVNLAPLELRLGTLEARRPVDLGPVEARLSALDKRQSDMGASLSRLDTLESRVAALEPRLAAAEAQGKQTAAGLSGITDRAQRAQRLIAASGLLESGQRLGDIPGAPPAVAKFAHEAPPTDAALRLSFNQAAEAAHRASQPAISDNQPFLDRIWTRAQQSVTVRQGDHVLVGDPIAGVLAGARQSLDAGDLAGAVKALDGLAGPAKAAMAGWVGRAQSLLDARAALAEMAAR